MYMYECIKYLLPIHWFPVQNHLLPLRLLSLLTFPGSQCSQIFVFIFIKC